MRQLTQDEVAALGLNNDTFDNSIKVASQNSGLHPDLIRGVIQHESGGNPYAVSPTGPQGAMQLSKAASEDVGLDPSQRFDADANIQAGTEYLKRMLDEFGPDLGFAAYHDGPTKVREAVKGNDFSGLSPEAIKYMQKFGSTQQRVEPSASNKLSPEDIAALGLNEPDVKPAAPMPKVEPIADETTFSNILSGFAARGNQAMAALNPWADMDKIAAEKEWVRTHSGADIGSIVADMLMTAPAGGLATGPLRAAGTGIIEGLTHPGDMADRLSETAMSTLASGAGEGIATGIGKVGRLFKSELDDVLAKLVQSAQDSGIPLDASQLTNNPVLGTIKQALKIVPSTATTMQEFADKQSKAYTNALFNVGHEAADIATPEVMATMKNRISSMYDDVLGRNDVIVDTTLKDALKSVKDEYMQIIPVNQRPIVKKYLSDLETPPVGALISGKTYQNIRSKLGIQSDALKNTDPMTAQALSSIKQHVDDALERSVSRRPLALNGGNIVDRSGDVAKLKQANYDNRVMKTISNAIDPVTHDVKPTQLLGKLARKEKATSVFGKGNRELVDIARVGARFVEPKISTEGAAQRLLITKMMTGAGNTGMGTLLGANILFSDDKASAAKESALAGLGMFLVPKLAAKSMLNPNGYFAKGMYDLNKEVLPGLARQKLISDMLRNLGNQSVQN